MSQPTQHHTFKDPKTGAAIAVKITPRAKKNAVVGVMDDGTIRIKLTAPPVEGAANRALIEYLAELFKVNKNNIEILAGLSSERKIVSIVGITPKDVENVVHQLTDTDAE